MPAASPTSGLPPELTQRLLGDVKRLARDLTRRLADEIGLPSSFRRTAYLRAVMAACREGLEALLRQLHDGTRIQPSELTRLGRAGAQQAEMGVPLEVLLSAYRLAAKVIWKEVIGEAAREHLLDPATAVALSEQVLEYLDEISGAVGRAYLDTRERLVRQRDRDRDRLLQRLLAGDSSAELRRLAAALDLPLVPPYRVVACSVAGVDDADAVLDAAWRDVGALLSAGEPGTWIALVPGAVHPLSLCRAGIAVLEARGVSVADGRPPLRIGTGPLADRLEDVATAARRARRALSIGARLAPQRVLHDDADLAIFGVLAQSQEELRAFVESTLGPVNGHSSRQATLLETLEAVLASSSVAEAATSLGVHRHTVVYRIERLRELLGRDTLDDPAQRHRLWLALQGRRLLESPALTSG